ncbi:MAG TPA: hypothetical protein VMH87_04975 [Pseudomonadales bacterium]|nr:hypothetical protein [Pseudomonadales bacterium]
MKLSEEQIQGLGLALNEATLLGMEASPERQLAGATFAVLTLPVEGPSPQDSRVQFIFNSVSRIAASLRHGRWDDLAAKVEKFGIEQLLEVVQRFRCPIYGWEFFNLDTQKFNWFDKLSLDWREKGNPANSLSFFQDGGTCHLDICLWFEDFTIKTPQGNEIALEEFIAGGKRWWDAMYAGDPRTQGTGIVPSK